MDFVFNCVSDCLSLQTQIANLVAGFQLLTTIFAQNPVSETFPQHSHQYRWTNVNAKWQMCRLVGAHLKQMTDWIS